MYLELKPLDTLRHADLPQVAAPWYAINWLKQARLGYSRIRGFNDALEACIQELDPRRDHWNHRAHGFEHLCAKINHGDWVVVLDPSSPPLAPAYAQINGQWQLTQHISEPRLGLRLESQVQTILRVQREQEVFQSRNQPPIPEQIEPASGPGNRVASLGPQLDTNSVAKPSTRTSETSNAFKDQDAAAKAALNEANPQSIKDNLEHGGLIYRYKDSGVYGYSGPIKGTDQGVNPFSAPIPSGAELVGDYHTHADYSVVDRETGAAVRTSNPLKDDFNSDNFSPDDLKGIKEVGKDIEGYKGYLGTPSGVLKVYNPATGMVSSL